MLTNRVHLGIARKGTTLADMYANYMETPIIGSAGKTVHAF